MRVGIYLRVSTKEQTTENQRMELERVAKQRGWTIVEIFEDAAISGSKGRDKRPAFDAMLKAAQRRDIDMIAAWSVDRLGRSLNHLVAFLEDIQNVGCNLYLHIQGLDTSTPSGKAMFQMLAVFGEFERAMIVERVNAGLARAKAKGVKLGRNKVEPIKETNILAHRKVGKGKLWIARTVGVGVSVVQRVLLEHGDPKPKDA
ncbi:recombinase family protein [Sphingomonas sp. CFBP 13706]|uniref:recombinase family protein n=1 Tax=Sphingomonas sp. CFBP 13706 TaxID=2775314 RepID=UPI001782239A|nr:recombinase family protein [Sphingomonas sp. CFBP 13706]MBD8734907.1 recombinase family protein [Sphingomonas sp. CFBP 13706]